MTQAITTKFYGNCQVYNLDNQLMFCCDQKKINWYLKRNLAEKLSDNSIRLLFKTKGNGHIGQEFFLNNKKNICVVCGGTDELTRHHVVPICYRRHFPDVYKNRFCFYILLLCISCHNKYEKVAFDFKKEIAKEFQVNVSEADSIITHKEKDRKNILRIKGFIDTLASEHRIPASRREVLEKEIQDYLISSGLTLNEIKNYCVPRKKRDRISFGEMAVKQIEDLPAFIKKWREHFISEMQPKYLPEGYDVNKYIERPNP